MSTRHPRLGLVQVSLAGVLWGTGGLVVQLIRERVPMSPLTISAWRTGIAALVLVATVILLRRLGEVRRVLGHRPWTALAVGLLTGAYQAFYFAAVIAVGVTVSTVVALGLAPVLLTAGESALARRLPDRAKLLVLAVALGGLVLVSTSTGGPGSGPRPVLGVLLASGSGVTYALATAWGRPLATVSGPLALTAVTTSAGALGMVPLGLLAGGSAMVTDPGALALLTYLGVMTLAAAYALLYAGLRTVEGSAALVATLLEPVTAAVLAATLLGERLGPPGLLGVLLILVAVAGLAERDDGRGAVPEGPAPL